MSQAQNKILHPLVWAVFLPADRKSKPQQVQDHLDCVNIDVKEGILMVDGGEPIAWPNSQHMERFAGSAPFQTMVVSYGSETSCLYWNQEE